MLEDLWNGLIGFLTQFVVPDWGATIGLLPIAIAVLVVLFFVWTIIRFATAGPTRRGVRRVTPLPPAGVHMPGPSFAPILAAIGAFLLFFGIATGGVTLLLGAIALFLALLYWGREGIRDYQHIPDVADGDAVALLPPPERTPPPGVHVPGPSFLPFLSALGAVALLGGLVFKGWILVLGVIVLVVGLAGWLGAAGREYRAVEEADVTGHLPSDTAPRWPTGTLVALAALFIFAVVLNTGVLPLGSGGAANAQGSPGARPASGAAGGAAAASASAPASQLPPADAVITAEQIAFT
ncbi:MAG: hypothetical protein ACJ77N_06640, partial [Chloroflexota bacterium]